MFNATSRAAHRTGLAFIVLFLAVVPTFGQITGPLGALPLPPPAPPADGVQVQTRGPIHEAFAQPSENAPAGPILGKRPPPPIPEEPPDQKPEGDNVGWIPGYWGWDADRNDFLWVSGTWRAEPAGRKWVPGRWEAVDGGYQWVAGFWAGANADDVPLRDEPPESLDVGPAGPAPDDNAFYVPGVWLWRDRWVWRPGYYAAPRPGQVWTPARWVYTPSGWAFVNGYWDYPLEDRGLLFAPVAFNAPLWEQPGWHYRPSYCVGLGNLLAALFVRPAHCHYYFGDYYGRDYLRAGYSPWFAWGRRHNDPLFGYYARSNRGDPGWYRGLADTYAGRYAGDYARPPRTLVAQNTTVNGVRVVQPLNQLNGTSLRLTKVNETQVKEARLRTEQFRSIHAQRGGPKDSLKLTNVPDPIRREGTHRVERPTHVPTPGDGSRLRTDTPTQPTPRPEPPRVVQPPPTAPTRPAPAPAQPPRLVAPAPQPPRAAPAPPAPQPPRAAPQPAPRAPVAQPAPRPPTSHAARPAPPSRPPSRPAPSRSGGKHGGGHKR